MSKKKRSAQKKDPEESIPEVRLPSVSSRKSTFLKRTMLALVVLYGSLITDVRFYGADSEEYYGYTESIVLDGDLNSFNNGKFPNEVTRTYNHPDFHPHGGVVLWAPLFLYGRLLGAALRSMSITQNTVIPVNTEVLPQLLMSLSTYAVSIATLLLLLNTFARFYPKRILLPAAILVLLGIPFSLYAIYFPGNANMFGLLLLVLLMRGLLDLAERTDVRGWFFLGLLFALSVLVKIDLWFYAVAVAAFFGLRFVNTGDHRGLIRSALSMAAGFLPIMALQSVNAYLMLGSFGPAQAGIFNANYNLFFYFLFSPYRGAIFMCPIILICLAALVYRLGCYRSLFVWGKRTKGPAMHDLLPHSETSRSISPHDSFREPDTDSREYLRMIMTGFLAAFVVKIYVCAHEYAWGGGSFGRVLLVDIPLFLYLLCDAALGMRLTRSRLAWVFVFIAPLSLWSFVNSLAFRFYTCGNWLSTLHDHIVFFSMLSPPAHIAEFLRRSFFVIQAPCEKLIAMAVASAFLYVLYLGCAAVRRGSSVQWFLNHRRQTFVVLCASIYLIITGLNCLNNRKNVERMRAQGAFANARVISSAEVVAHENIGSMQEMLVVFSAQGNSTMVAKVQRTLDAYIVNLKRSRATESDLRKPARP